MLEQITRLNGDQLLFLSVMASMVLTAVTIVLGVVAVQVRKYRERQLDLGFKDDLLRRGLSVDEAVRLLTTSRPTWPESMTSLGDWMARRVSRGLATIGDALPRLWRPCRRMLHQTWQQGAKCCRIVWREGHQWSRAACRQARPVARRSMKSLNRFVHWLGDQTDRLVRRWAPQRP